MAEAAGLVNLSARGVTGGGAETLTAGFVISGPGSKRVLVRAAGPALTALGVPGALGAPRLELFRGGVPVAANDAWDAGAGAARCVTPSARWRMLERVGVIVPADATEAEQLRWILHATTASR